LPKVFYLCVTCTEDVPFIKAAEIQPQTEGTFMGNYRIEQQQRACKNWTKGMVGAGFLKPVVSVVPTLIVSGVFDSVTPSGWAKQIASNLSNSTLVIIPNMAHLFEGLSNEPCFDNLVMEFIANPRSKTLHADCVNEMLPPPYKMEAFFFRK